MKKLLIISTVVFSTVFLSQVSKASNLSVNNAFYQTRCETSVNKSELFQCMRTELVNANCKKGIQKRSIRKKNRDGGIKRSCYNNTQIAILEFLSSTDFLIANPQIK